MSIPNVIIIISDNGANAAVQIPQSNIQVVMGCAAGWTSATPSAPIAISSPSSLLTNFTAGPLVEAAGLVCQAGGTAICVALPITTTGTATAVTATVPGGSSSTATVTLDGTVGAFDDYYVRVKCLTMGTIGSPGIQYQVSLDAGRNYGPLLNLATSGIATLTNTGVTVTFGSGTMKAGDYWSFSTKAPAWNDAGVTAAVAVLAASQYALAGWGSLHLVGVSSSGNTGNLETLLDGITSQYIFTRALTSARDASPPVVWGGSGETETAWISSIETNFSAAATKRVCVGAGYYNTPSPFPNAVAGLPFYRRSLTWSDAVRRVLVPTQRRGGRVKDGPLANIVVNPSTDPSDGFIYHDERIVGGLTQARFMAAITWAKSQGFFVEIESLMSPTGSQFTELPIGNVIDVACDVAYAVGVSEISDDLRLTAAGTLYPTDAITLQNQLDGALATNMTNVSMVSDAYSSVSQTANVGATNNIPITISVQSRLYVDTITETINLLTT